METYERDPEHPDAHPIHDGSENKRVVYDHSLLSEKQKFWEGRRVWRKEQMKKRRLLREAKVKKEREERGEHPKEHAVYIKPYAGITPPDLDGTVEKCTECNASLWGTEYVYPLWKMDNSKSPSRVMYPPYCEGCYRLFDVPDITMKGKIEIIRWISTGIDDNIAEDQPYPKNSIDYRAIAHHMEERARKMVSKILYDHPSWDCLKSKVEISFEIGMENPTLNENQISMYADEYIRTTPGISIVPPTPINNMDIASAAELEDLVVRTDGVDAMLGYVCSPVRSSQMAVSFDHIEPASKVRYRPGSFSIGNIQLLSKCLNRVKGNYNNKELARWLSQLLEAYDERYGE